MLYRESTTPPQDLRTRCRNPRCGCKLKYPADNPRRAFCCSGCSEQFYRHRCLVCEALFSRKTERRRTCGRGKCRNAYGRYPERFNGPWAQTPDLRHNASRNPLKTGTKIDDKSGRGWRVVAGPEPPEINLRIPPTPATIPETNRLFLEQVRRKAGEARRITEVCFRRTLGRGGSFSQYRAARSAGIKRRARQ
jgi:hypothetical protein